MKIFLFVIFTGAICFCIYILVENEALTEYGAGVRLIGAPVAALLIAAVIGRSKL
jgi:hypothetical protein